nr:response regulator [Bradyrhizobium symbiodeficiens]
MLVDDDPVNREVGKAIPNRLGHHAAIATDGTSAVALARDQSFDVILMDLHMPDMDGVEAASRLGKLGLPSTPRVIAVTADVSSSARAARRRRHRSNGQQADPDQRGARGDRGRTGHQAVGSATVHGSIDRPALSRQRACTRSSSRPNRSTRKSMNSRTFTDRCRVGGYTA